MLVEEELNSIVSYNALCELQPVTINGVNLDYKDFGDKEDIDRDKVKGMYGCGNMQFLPYWEVKESTLQKYNITQSEYRQIQKKLECLSFGSCWWCS